MPSKQLEQHKIGHFGFSAVHTDDLGATEYTLVTIACDRSGSTDGFQKDMEKVLQEVVKACQLSPRADNLLIRVIKFDHNKEEVHGFKLLEQINLADYDGILAPGGSTLLFDSMVDSIEGTANYAKQLFQQEMSCNGIVFFITDGLDNQSTFGYNQIKDGLVQTVKSEFLESMVSILIGVNIQDSHIKSKLEEIKTECGLTQFVPLADASKKTLAKLAQFVSKSISSQSSALGTGASQTVKF